MFGLGAERISMVNFVLAAADEPGQLALVSASGERLFTLANAHAYRDAAAGKLFIMQMDLQLGADLAGRLGTPEFEGLVVGVVDLSAQVMPIGAAVEHETAAGTCSPAFGDFTVDIELLALDGIGQLAREPGVRVAFAPSATLQNVGVNDIRWYWAIAPQGFNGPNIGAHPFLVMHYYRIADGKLEQIARSQLKHAWNTVNARCPCAGGQVMFVGCEDTYGIGNNGNQFYFGPRDELTAHTGAWTSLGSHFDATPADDFRDHGSGAHDAFEHRLVVAEADLTTADAQYLVDAWYIVAGDVDIFNSMGYRHTTQSLLSGVWNFTFTDSATTLGPAINAWVNPDAPGPLASNRLLDTGVGHLQLAARVSDLGAGRYRYEYALMNLDFDRQVSRFSVPLRPGVSVSAIDFGDPDADAANDWVGVATSGAVEFVSPDGNELDWGTLYNFGFEAESAPALAGALMQALEDGDADYLALPVMAPVHDAGAPDTDSDGILDNGDNCTLVANPDQRDTDGDRYGNVCDPDFNNDGLVNFVDLQRMKSVFFNLGDLDEDLTGDGAVNFADLTRMKDLFFAAPGPSGTAR